MLPPLRKNARYHIACPTSMGVRITPEGHAPTHTADRFFMQATSAESNVLSVAASLGMPCLAMTNFVQGSPISAFIKAQLRGRGIDFVGPNLPQGGPWGLRHQFNIADSGFGPRAPRVWNDRAGEAGRVLSLEDYDVDGIFMRDGVRILHISGLIAALSGQTTALCLALAKAARDSGALVSFDLNYRASFWQGREAELGDAFRRIAAQADILVGNEEDFQLCLGLQGPETGGEGLAGKVAAFQGMISAAQRAYPQASVFATTLRQATSANQHLWGALLLAEDGWHTEPPRAIDVLDRIGGGDGFTGGMLYGILRGWPPQKWLQFGWACGALAAASLYDYAAPADEKQVWDVYGGNARVQR